MTESPKTAPAPLDYEDFARRLLARKEELTAMANEAETLDDLREVVLLLIRTL